MPPTLFTNISFTLQGLISQIHLGAIGLPDLQRPFVWPNTKVRDLFDSMYRGYPVGYLLLWQNGGSGAAHGIGTERKQVPVQSLVIDGQQRLTSLYAVFRGVPVLRENFSQERIHIAFRPLDGEFAVADAAIKRDPTWIPDISVLWADGANLFRLVSDYLSAVGAVRTIDAKEQEAIQEAVIRLHQLQAYTFTALSLSAETGEEQVGEIFVRINSKGTPLNQADFILTLMSVFRDKQRAELEAFCRKARTPAPGVASPFNHFLEPDPDHLLRVAVGLAFRRARLEFVYSILRGKDLETGKFSDERRDKQFEELQKAQDYALNLGNWHGFFKCLMQAGFRSGRFISSRNTIIYTYVLYLIARRDFGLTGHELQTLIARWFFFASLTGRYTNSPESAMDADLADLRAFKNASELTSWANRLIDSAFTSDYWAVTLPNELVSSSARGPAVFAYYAALNLLDARVLFSTMRVRDLMDPVIQGTRANLERHHLFPRAYLQKKGYSAVRDINQIANFALIEWEANNDISDEAPPAYLARKYGRLVEPEAAYWNALPEGWPGMEYLAFLAARRPLIAKAVRDGFERIGGARASESDTQPSLELSPTGRWLSHLPADVRAHLEPLLKEPLRPLSDTLLEVLEYSRSLAAQGLDATGLREVADTCERLISAALGSTDPEHHRIAQAAALYFLLDEDAAADTGEGGFHDDLRVAREAIAVLKVEVQP